MGFQGSIVMGNAEVLAIQVHDAPGIVSLSAKCLDA